MELKIKLSEKIWDLYQTHGVPFEASFDILNDKDLSWDQGHLDNLIKEHQEKSQSIAKGVFKAGVGMTTDKTKALHTATHILHRVLKDNLGDNVNQIGSNITEQKARFDISISADKLDPAVISKIENEVNEIIQKSLKMGYIETSPDEAKKNRCYRPFWRKIW